MTPDPSRSYHRFDSLTELVDFCRQTYETDDVFATTEDGILVVRIGRPEDQPLTRLVVHLEGERTYLIGLPDTEPVAGR